MFYFHALKITNKHNWAHIKLGSLGQCQLSSIVQETFPLLASGNAPFVPIHTSEGDPAF